MSGFFTTTSKLFLTKTGASIILLMAFPILSRLYDPEHFGIQALYTSLVMLFTPIACLRCDMAMIVEKNDSSARTLLFLCICCSVAIATFFGFVLHFIAPIQTLFSELNTYASISLLIAINFSLEGISIAMLSFATRQALLHYVIATDIVRALVMVGYPILIAFIFSTSAMSLIYGYLFASLASCLICLPLVFRALALSSRDRVNLTTLLRKKRSFLLYGSMGSFFNGLAAHTPNIIIGSLFGKEILGFVNAATRLLALPARTMGAAVSRTFFTKTKSSTSGHDFVRNTELSICSLMYVIVLLILLVPSSKLLFAFLLGNEWGEVGRYFNVLLFFYAAWTLTSPLSSIFSTRDRQQLLFRFQLAKFLVRVSSLLVGSKLFGIEDALLFYAVISGLIQLIQTSTAYVLAGGKHLTFYYLLARGVFPAIISSLLITALLGSGDIFVLGMFSIICSFICIINIYRIQNHLKAV